MLSTGDIPRLREEEQRQNRRVRDISQFRDHSWPLLVQEDERIHSLAPLPVDLHTFLITFLTPHTDCLAWNEHLWIIKLRITLSRVRELPQCSPVIDSQLILSPAGLKIPPRQPYWPISSYFNVSLRSWFNSRRVEDASSRANHLDSAKGSEDRSFKAIQPAHILHRSSQEWRIRRIRILIGSLVLVEVEPIAFALILMKEENGLCCKEVDSDYFCSLCLKGVTSLKGMALR